MSIKDWKNYLKKHTKLDLQENGDSLNVVKGSKTVASIHFDYASYALFNPVLDIDGGVVAHLENYDNNIDNVLEELTW